MHTKPFSKHFPFKQVFIYTVMTMAVFIVVSLITLFMLGYRVDTDKGNIERYAFLQFSSSPSGATVSVDGNITGSKTPSKTTVPAGSHDIVMWRSGYEKWQKSVNLKPGTLTWLNYTLLVPKSLKAQYVGDYPTISSSLASPKGHYILIQAQAGVAKFSLIDLSANTVKSVALTLPSTIYTQSSGSVFKPEKWSENERYVLVSHTYDGNKQEWLLVDTQNLDESKNITNLFDMSFTQVNFADSGGNNLYVLHGGDIRKLDLGAATISKPLVNNATSYSFYNKSKVITYLGVDGTKNKNRVAGIFREGDQAPYVMKTVSGDNKIPLRISTANYFNENYVAISYGKSVEILSGSYPNTTSDNANNMKKIEFFNTKQDVGELTFSPTGKYVFIQSGENFTSYDLEYQKLAESSIKGSGSVFAIEWLDENHIWSIRDNKLTIREFDGANVHNISSAVDGQDAVLTNNGRFLYSIGKSKSSYHLQRVRMILP